MQTHGVEKTLQEYGALDEKITRRKLKGWQEAQNKVKGVKGRKTSDASRDQALYEWCLKFQQEKGRAPTRKEAAQVALEYSHDEAFKASKGWLDKFSKKYQIDFTPLKVFPSRAKKLKKEGDLGESEETPSRDGTSSIYSDSHRKDLSEDEGPLSEADENSGAMKFPLTENFLAGSRLQAEKIGNGHHPQQ